MKKHQRDQRGNAISWHRTKYGKLQREKVLFFARCQLYGISASTFAQATSIQAVTTKTPEERVRKAMAIAEAIVAGQISMMGVLSAYLGDNR